MGQARLAKVYLIVYHARQQVQSGGINHAVGGLARQVRTDLSNKTTVYQYVGFNRAPFINESGVQDKEFHSGRKVRRGRNIDNLRADEIPETSKTGPSPRPRPGPAR